MSKINDGGPAYPFEGGFNHGPLVSPGMTLRDHFAGLAMQGMLVGRHNWDDDLVATNAYRMADAMLRAREATNV